MSAKWDRQIAESIKWIEQEFGEVDVIFDSSDTDTPNKASESALEDGYYNADIPIG